jgi:bifunctional DNase/RNase
VLPLDVVGIRVDKANNNPVVVLREVGGERFLPIWIGAVEATAIAYAQEKVEVPRPLTHDLFIAALAALGQTLEEVRIVGLEDGVYFAELVFTGGATVSARPSDAIALALRSDARILGAEEVLEHGGVGYPAEDEVVVEQFREFLDHVSPEDFDPKST